MVPPVVLPCVPRKENVEQNSAAVSLIAASLLIQWNSKRQPKSSSASVSTKVVCWTGLVPRQWNLGWQVGVVHQGAAAHSSLDTGGNADAAGKERP